VVVVAQHLDGFVRVDRELVDEETDVQSGNVESLTLDNATTNVADGFRRRTRRRKRHDRRR
jgi:hypothetical protein